MAKRQKGERQTYCLPTYPHTHRQTTDSKRHKVSDHNAQTNGYIFYKTDFLPLSYFEGKKQWKKGKKSRAAYIPFLFFDFRPSIRTIIIIIVTQIIIIIIKKSIRF